MKYAIDLDDTVFDFKHSFCLFCKVEYNIDFSENDLSYQHFITKKLGERRAKQILKDFGKKEGYTRLKEINGAFNALKELGKSNDIYIMTCRPSIFRGQTEKSLSLAEIYPKEIFINDKVDKVNICKALSVDCIIEDNAKCCTEAIKSGIRAYLMEGKQNIFGKSVFLKTYTWPEILREEKAITTINVSGVIK